jgi:inhibitor of cysteine peptidase
MMSHKTILIAGLVLIVLVTAGTLAAMAMSTDGAGESQVYTAADDGTSIEAGVGQSFSIVLAGNPTTGYGWQVEGIDGTVLTASEPVYVSDSDLIGSGGTYTFTFTAAAAGDTEVRLVYLRSWEQAEPLETFTMIVTVP